MRILLTGGNGFLGTNIVRELKNHEIITLSRSNANVSCDLTTQIPILPICHTIIHSAGKAHLVPKTDRDRKKFFDVNVKGTENLLLALENVPSLPKSFVFISSVAVYGLSEGTLINEDISLGAKDPYGLSKIHAEKIVQEWCSKHNIVCTILRLPLLIGQNPPGNLGAMIRGIEKGYYFNISGGKARKSMVLAKDVAKFITPASKVGGVYNLTDGYHPNFKELSICISKQLNKSEPLNIPEWMANLLARTGNLLGKNFPFNSYRLSKITADLTFDDTKARNAFNWNPKSVLDSFLLNDKATV